MVLDGPIGAKTSKVYTASGSSVSGIDRKKVSASVFLNRNRTFCLFV